MLYQDVLLKMMRLKGINASELADKVGTSRGYISQLLAGKVKEPSFTRILDICHVLGITVEELMSSVATGKPINPPSINKASPELEELIDAFIQLPLPDQRGIIRICKALVKHLD